MTEARLKQLRALCEAATPGPWTFDPLEWAVIAHIPSEGEECVLVETTAGFATEEDWKFIAAARTALPELIAEVERLEQRNANADDLLRRSAGALAKAKETLRMAVEGK